MPAGIIATIDGGYATLDFIDKSLRGPALAALIELAGPDAVETITRRGPRRTYRVLVGNAVEAGLIDGDEDGRVASAGHDSGNAAALVAADPNVNPGEDNANWHTPYDEYTSRNKFVGETTVTEARAASDIVYTGTAEAFGGSKASDNPLHTDVIEHVAGHRVKPVQFVDFGDDVPHPGQEANARLATIKATESTDPQGATTLPADRPGGAAADLDDDDEGGMGVQSFARVASTDQTSTEPAGDPADPSEVGQPITTDPATATAAYPDGAPTIDWKRSELDAYAAAAPRNLDTTGLTNKQAVLDAINAAN